jgi:phosphate transport system protein
VERDADAATELNERDDELDELHVSLTAELVSGQLTVPIALEMALVARFYERLGDHAVNIGERIRYIAAGSL